MKTAIISLKNSQFTFYILASGVLLSFALYMFFINDAVRHAVTRNDSETAISKIQNKVSDLEYAYMNKENAFTIGSAKDAGLVEPTNKIFISQPSGPALSYNSR